MKLQCTWPSGVDIDGLNKPDKRRIAKIGLRAWLAEDHKAGPAVAVKRTRKALTKKKGRVENGE